MLINLKLPRYTTQTKLNGVEEHVANDQFPFAHMVSGYYCSKDGVLVKMF